MAERLRWERPSIQRRRRFRHKRRLEGGLTDAWPGMPLIATPRPICSMYRIRQIPETMYRWVGGVCASCFVG
jgi:hypothetical protein